MRAKDLILGESYLIYYRHNIVDFDVTTNGRKYHEPEKYGRGKLVAINDPRPGFHTFQLDATAVLVYANSRGIQVHVDSKQANFKPNIIDIIAKSGHSISTDDLRSREGFAPLQPPSKELAKLQKLGYDDKTRVKEIISIVELLNGLGIAATPNADNTAITVPWVGLATFKTLVKTLYFKSVLEGLDDEG
jgi:hypothetical protein